MHLFSRSCMARFATECILYDADIVVSDCFGVLNELQGAVGDGEELLLDEERRRSWPPNVSKNEYHVSRAVELAQDDNSDGFMGTSNCSFNTLYVGGKDGDQVRSQVPMCASVDAQRGSDPACCVMSTVLRARRSTVLANGSNGSQPIDTG